MSDDDHNNNSKHTVCDVGIQAKIKYTCVVLVLVDDLISRRKKKQYY